MIRETEFSTIEAAANSLAEDLAAILQKAVDSTGNGYFAVSGVRTTRRIKQRAVTSLIRGSREWIGLLIPAKRSMWT